METAIGRGEIRARHAAMGVAITSFLGMAQMHQLSFSGRAVLWPYLSQVGASRPLVRHE